MTREQFNRALKIEEAMQRAFYDPTKAGIFKNHRCVMCNDGAKPCVEGAQNLCGYPHARND